MVCSAAWSIGLSADEPAVEPGREHAAIKDSNTDQQTRVGTYGKFKDHLPMITVAGYLTMSKTYS